LKTRASLRYDGCMERYTDVNLKQNLQKRPCRLYYLVGNDVFLTDLCVRNICAAAQAAQQNIAHFDQKDLSNGGFQELFYSFSMLPENRVAVVDDFNYTAKTFKNEDKKLLEECLSDIPDDLTVILRQVWDDRKPATASVESMVSKVKDSAVVTISAKTGTELEKYIEYLARRENCTIASPAAKALARLAGNDLQLLDSEIKKLAACANYSQIRLSHVEELTPRTAEAGVFEMISAMEKGDCPRAFSLLTTMLDDREEPLRITALINNSFLNIYRAKLASDKGMGAKNLTEVFGGNPNSLSIAFGQSRRYTLAKIERVIELLYQLDKKLKSSAVNSRYILEQKVIEIAVTVAS